MSGVSGDVIYFYKTVHDANKTLNKSCEETVMSIVYETDKVCNFCMGTQRFCWKSQFLYFDKTT